MVEKQLSLKNAKCLVLSIHGWGNRKKVKDSKVQTNGAAAKMITQTKRLIDPDGGLAAINTFMNTTTKGWILKRSVPGVFSEGTYLFSNDMVPVVNTFLKESAETLKGLVEEFIAEYDAKITEAERLLGPALFIRSEYPTAAELRKRFYFDAFWLKIDVDQDIPAEIYAEQKAKAEAKWADATEEITEALRNGFKKLIDHAVNNLAPGPYKQIGWKDTTITNITEFCDLFAQRNLTNDTELDALVSKAKGLLTGIDDPQRLKKNRRLWKEINDGFAEITKNLDALVKPKRAFDLE